MFLLGHEIGWLHRNFLIRSDKPRSPASFVAKIVQMMASMERRWIG